MTEQKQNKIQQLGQLAVWMSLASLAVATLVRVGLTLLRRFAGMTEGKSYNLITTTQEMEFPALLATQTVAWIIKRKGTDGKLSRAVHWLSSGSGFLLSFVWNPNLFLKLDSDRRLVDQIFDSDGFAKCFV